MLSKTFGLFLFFLKVTILIFRFEYRWTVHKSLFLNPTAGVSPKFFYEGYSERQYCDMQSKADADFQIQNIFKPNIKLLSREITIHCLSQFCLSLQIPK